MGEKLKIDLRKFEPEKIPAKYWLKFTMYALILTGLYFWYKHKSDNRVNTNVKQKELDLQGFRIEEKQ